MEVLKQASDGAYQIDLRQAVYRHTYSYIDNAIVLGRSTQRVVDCVVGKERGEERLFLDSACTA